MLNFIKYFRTYTLNLNHIQRSVVLFIFLGCRIFNFSGIRISICFVVKSLVPHTQCMAGCARKFCSQWTACGEWGLYHYVSLGSVTEQCSSSAVQSVQLVIRRVKFGVKHLILIIILADYTQFGILNDTSWEIKSTQ